MHISIRVLDVKQETQLHKRKPTSHQQQHASQLPFRSIFLQQPNCNATVMYMNRVKCILHVKKMDKLVQSNKGVQDILFYFMRKQFISN